MPLNVDHQDQIDYEQRSCGLRNWSYNGQTQHKTRHSVIYLLTSDDTLEKSSEQSSMESFNCPILRRNFWRFIWFLIIVVLSKIFMQHIICWYVTIEVDTKAYLIKDLALNFIPTPLQVYLYLRVVDYNPVKDSGPGLEGSELQTLELKRNRKRNDVSSHWDGLSLITSVQICFYHQ